MSCLFQGFREKVKHMNIITDTSATSYILLGLRSLRVSTYPIRLSLLLLVSSILTSSIYARKGTLSWRLITLIKGKRSALTLFSRIHTTPPFWSKWRSASLVGFCPIEFKIVRHRWVASWDFKIQRSYFSDFFHSIFVLSMLLNSTVWCLSRKAILLLYMTGQTFH